MTGFAKRPGGPVLWGCRPQCAAVCDSALSSSGEATGTAGLIVVYNQITIAPLHQILNAPYQHVVLPYGRASQDLPGSSKSPWPCIRQSTWIPQKEGRRSNWSLATTGRARHLPHLTEVILRRTTSSRYPATDRMVKWLTWIAPSFPARRQGVWLNHLGAATILLIVSITERWWPHLSGLPWRLMRTLAKNMQPAGRIPVPTTA